MKRTLLLVTLCFGCPRERASYDSLPGSASSTKAPATSTKGPLGGERPVRAFIPAKTTAPAPVILVLHGYGGHGAGQLSWFGLDERPDAHVVAPDGTMDGTGRRFWNAVDTCCDFERTGVDDVKYLLSLVDEVAARHAVDRTRIYAVGLSNGGSMALRLACDRADAIAAVVSFAAPWSETTSCALPPGRVPVSVRMLHGTSDPVVPFGGGGLVKGIHPNAQKNRRSPGARVTAEGFAKLAGCAAPRTLDAVDLDPSIPGAETVPTVFDGCAPGTSVEFLTMNGSEHVPPQLSSIGERTWTFLAAHHR